MEKNELLLVIQRIFLSVQVKNGFSAVGPTEFINEAFTYVFINIYLLHISITVYIYTFTYFIYIDM